MKRILFASALALAVSPALADDDYGQMNKLAGHVDGYIGGLWLSIDGDTSDATAYGGAGRLNIPFEQMWNVQFDGNVSVYSGDGSTIAISGSTVHAYWRDSSSYAFGGFAALEHYDLDSISFYGWHVGVEGQHYMGNTTLYGQAWGGELVDSGSSITELGLRGVVRYYGHENFRIDGEFSYVNLSGAGGGADSFALGTMAMYQFAGTGISVYGRYDYKYVDTDGSSSADIHLLTVGLRGTFASGGMGHEPMTLIEDDRSGATMESPHIPVNALF